MRAVLAGTVIAEAADADVMLIEGDGALPHSAGEVAP